MSPCFSGCSRPEHSTVRCPGVSRHEQAHRLMASMGLFRLDDPSLWTQHSRTAGHTASSFSLISPRLLQVFLAIAFRLYIRRALSLAPVVELILFRPPACRFGQRFVSERDSWIPRPYCGIRSTLVLFVVPGFPGMSRLIDSWPRVEFVDLQGLPCLCSCLFA